MTTHGIERGVLLDQAEWEVHVSRTVPLARAGVTSLHCLALQDSGIAPQLSRIYRDFYLINRDEPSREPRLVGKRQRRALDAATQVVTDFLDTEYGVMVRPGGDYIGVVTDDVAVTWLSRAITISAPRARARDLELDSEFNIVSGAQFLNRAATQFLDVDPKSAVEQEIVAQLDDALLSFPVPQYGSPPSAWNGLRSALGGGSSLTVTGLLLATGHPVMVLCGVTGTFILWYAKPSVKVLRRRTAERVAEKVGTTLQDDDLT